MLDVALDLHAGDADALHTLGESLATLDAGKQALTAYRAALAADPDHVRALVGVGNLELEFDRHAESLEAFELALTLLPELTEQAALHRSMGEAAMELGHAEAADYFERALAVDPQEYASLDRLAMLRFNQERYAEALDLYETMLELRPGSHTVQTNLGLTYFRLGQNVQAREHVVLALAVDPGYELAQAVLALIDEGNPESASDIRN